MRKEIAEKNRGDLSNNAYPGRGIVVGRTKDERFDVQLYWIMGRSENSRNRIFVIDGKGLQTKAFDESKMKDPSLVIYAPMKTFEQAHIVSNGDQTDTIYRMLEQGGSFEAAMETRTYEPDPPNYTPRIAGLIDLNDPHMAYRLSILKTMYNDPDYAQKHYYHYEKACPGFGHMICTYEEDGDPLPSFQTEPKLMPIYDTAKENLSQYWEMLNDDNRVALAVKLIDLHHRTCYIHVINRLS